MIESVTEAFWQEWIGRKCLETPQEKMVTDGQTDRRTKGPTHHQTDAMYDAMSCGSRPRMLEKNKNKKLAYIAERFYIMRVININNLLRQIHIFRALYN